ncbi:hypothetical protein [Mobiluncus porci]|uniref:Uncharacterized protein n=1 Tax=Mobiluncus porci TaxID=2652278 RepID=A0A7K0K6D2_9ACTO|nr:hypothetical protein [Mobiluncus porci]MST50575.1 hypothetical protein [Mobiluncus porci]
MEPILKPETLEALTGGQILSGDPAALLLIDSVTAAIRSFCGWHVAPVVTETVTLDGTGGYHLNLPTGRLLDVTGLKIAGIAAPPESYDWSQSGMIQLRGGRFPARFRSVEVTMRHGYSLEEVPDVAQIIRQVVVNAAASPMGVLRENAGGVSIEYSTTGAGIAGGVSLLARDRAALAPYRIAGRIS